MKTRIETKNKIQVGFYFSKIIGQNNTLQNDLSQRCPSSLISKFVLKHLTRLLRRTRNCTNFDNLTHYDTRNSCAHIISWHYYSPRIWWRRRKKEFNGLNNFCWIILKMLANGTFASRNFKWIFQFYRFFREFKSQCHLRAVQNFEGDINY